MRKIREILRTQSITSLFLSFFSIFAVFTPFFGVFADFSGTSADFTELSSFSDLFLQISDDVETGPDEDAMLKELNRHWAPMMAGFVPDADEDCVGTYNVMLEEQNVGSCDEIDDDFLAIDCRMNHLCVHSAGVVENYVFCDEKHANLSEKLQKNAEKICFLEESDLCGFDFNEWRRILAGNITENDFYNCEALRSVPVTALNGFASQVIARYKDIEQIFEVEQALGRHSFTLLFANQAEDAPFDVLLAKERALTAWVGQSFEPFAPAWNDFVGNVKIDDYVAEELPWNLPIKPEVVPEKPEDIQKKEGFTAFLKEFWVTARNLASKSHGAYRPPKSWLGETNKNGMFNPIESESWEEVQESPALPEKETLWQDLQQQNRMAAFNAFENWALNERTCLEEAVSGGEGLISFRDLFKKTNACEYNEKIPVWRSQMALVTSDLTLDDEKNHFKKENAWVRGHISALEWINVQLQHAKRTLKHLNDETKTPVLVN